MITSFFNNKHTAIVADPVPTDHSVSSRENTSSPKEEKVTVENGCALNHRLAENSIMTETTNISRTDQPVSPAVTQLQPLLERAPSSKSLSPPLSSGDVMSQTVLGLEGTGSRDLGPQALEPAVEKENNVSEKVTPRRKRKRSKSKCDSNDEDVNISVTSQDASNSNCNGVSQPATADKEEKTSDRDETQLESPLPVSERRSKRIAAIAADSKLAQVNNDADSISSSPLPQSKRTRKRRKKSFLDSSDEVDQEDEVTVLSSASPSPVDRSACMILGTDFFASAEPESSPSLQATANASLMDKVVPSTSSLSSSWATLFRKPPPDPSLQDIGEEDASTSQRKRQKTPSPRKCLSPRKNVFSSPRASPRLSPRASPKCSPLRGSPKRSSPLRRQLVGQASPQKNHSSLVFSSSRKQLSFGSAEMLDYAPFHSLVHVQQIDEPLIPVLNTNQFGPISKKLSSINVSNSTMQLGTVTMVTEPPHPQSTTPVQVSKSTKK